jgi:hypothetical protein
MIQKINLSLLDYKISKKSVGGFEMKKMGCAMALFFGITAAVFSYEGRFSVGFVYGNFFERRTDAGIDLDTYMGSPGLELSFYHFWDNLGFFHINSFLFPSNIKTNIVGYDYFFQYIFIIGPAFKITFTEKLDMTLGFGFSLGPTVGKPSSMFNMGIGGDIGISFFLNTAVYINIGSMFSNHFVNFSSLGNGTYDRDGDENKDTVRSSNYNLFGVRPYIRIGWSINTNNFRKPKENG